MKDKKCEVCEEDAIYKVCDVKGIKNHETRYYDFSIIGKPHFYCKKHSRKAKTIYEK